MNNLTSSANTSLALTGNKKRACAVVTQALNCLYNVGTKGPINKSRQ